MSCGCGNKEEYGDVKLDWGVYPIGLQYDDGGCEGDDGAPLADGQSIDRAMASKRNTQQRGGNNAYKFESTPVPLQYAIGTGCMNPMCKCPNCQGDCKCMKMFTGRHGIMFWAILVIGGWLLYKAYKKGMFRR